MSNQIIGSDAGGQSSHSSYGATRSSNASMMPMGGSRRGIAQRLSRGIPSEPLLGALPLARLIPQDIHSVADYANGIAVATGVSSRDPRAQLASIILAASVIGVSAITDYRLSIAKLVPIEAHEAIDHLWGLSAIAAPFVFGYWKTSPRIGMTHVITGAATILASLFTDYRAYRGVGHGRRAARF